MAGQPSPDDFRCPISLEIMSDPVILSSGHTFDRSSIQRWLDIGHRTCPITNLPLPPRPTLIPNHALRSLISNLTLPPPPSQPPPTQNSDNPQSLVSALNSPSSAASALSRLVKLSKRDAAFRRQLAESGTVSAVLSVLDSDDSAVREKALNLVLNLSLDDDNKVGLVAEGAVQRIVAALRGKSENCRALAATIITSLAVVEVNKAIIGEYPYAIETLISLLKNGNNREIKEAATALFALCSFPDNRRRAVRKGSVPVLLRIADSGLERAVEVLGMLAKCREGREVMERCNGCVRIMVKVLRNGNSKGVQYALLTLYSLCCHHSERMCMEVKKDGVFEICRNLLEDGDEKIRVNASRLVEVLTVSGE